MFPSSYWFLCYNRCYLCMFPPFVGSYVTTRSFVLDEGRVLLFFGIFILGSILSFLFLMGQYFIFRGVLLSWSWEVSWCFFSSTEFCPRPIVLVSCITTCVAFLSPSVFAISGGRLTRSYHAWSDCSSACITRMLEIPW
jgi:hypothetical protein